MKKLIYLCLAVLGSLIVPLSATESIPQPAANEETPTKKDKENKNPTEQDMKILPVDMPTEDK